MGINPSIHHYVTYTMSIHHYVTLRHIYSPLRLIKSHLLIIPAHYVFIPTVSSTLRFITPHYAWYFSTNRGCNMLIWSITPLRHVFSSFYCITTHYGTLRPLRLLRPLRQIVTPWFWVLRFNKFYHFEPRMSLRPLLHKTGIITWK